MKRTENYIFSYYQQMKDGRVTAGEWIHRLYEKVVRGLQEKIYIYDHKKATHAIEWIEEHCRHVEGPLAPGPFLLELWQKALLSVMYGVLDPKSGCRQFREILLVEARKNGKSILASAIAQYELRENGGYGCRVYNVAPKLDQADIIYANTWTMIQLDPDQIERREKIEEERKTTHQKVEDDPEVVKKRASDLFYPATNSTMKKIPFAAKRADGFNPSLAICDEIAAWEGDKGLKQYEVMKSGMGARPEALMLSCTTSGYVNDGIYDELVKRATRFLLGDSKETRLLPFLYMIDDVEKWNDINELRKSNPNLGVSVSVDYLLEEIAVAEGSLSKKAEFLTKYCCIKQNSSQAWLSTETVNKAYGVPLSLEDFRGCYCVGGIDLSRTTDLTSACVVIEKGGRLYVFSKFWLPSELIQEATTRDSVPYNIYIQRGFLEPSGYNFVDYTDCFNWFRDLVEKYEILPLKVGYDRYNAQYLTQQMSAYGFQMDDVYQGFNLSPVLMETEGLLRDEAISIGDNDLLKIHMLDSALKKDAETGKSKLIKLSKNAHIDGMAALIDAMTVRQKHFAEIGDQLRNE